MNWQKIWNNEERINNIIEESLYKLDGYDTEHSAMTSQIWKEYIYSLEEFIKIPKGDSVYEVGCGAGATLFSMGHEKCGGCDISLPLLSICEKFVQGNFHHCGADEIDGEMYDHVISIGVFLYFSDLGYSERVLKKMLDKARKSVCITDVVYPNANDERHLKIPEQFFVDFCEENGYEFELENIQSSYGNASERYAIRIIK